MTDSNQKEQNKKSEEQPPKPIKAPITKPASAESIVENTEHKKGKPNIREGG